MTKGTYQQVLDDPQIYPRLDPSGMRQRILDLPKQGVAAWRHAEAFIPPKSWGPFNKIVICGMGGSAIAGDLAADLASLQKTAPILVVRDFNLPFALDRKSLVIVCSYSGNTEETLSLFQQVLEFDAPVLAMTSDGILATEASKRRFPLLSIDAPGEPRSALGYSLMLLLAVLARLGHITITSGEVRVATEKLMQHNLPLGEGSPLERNPAKQLALELQNRLILVYGGGLFNGVARRWKTQLNENAKSWAFFESIPEALHNTVEAFGSSPEIAERLMVLLLQPEVGMPSLNASYEVITELLSRNRVTHRVLRGMDGTPLEQLLSLLSLGDYASYYLAMLRKVDPSHTPNIVWYKQWLADRIKG